MSRKGGVKEGREVGGEVEDEDEERKENGEQVPLTEVEIRTERSGGGEAGFEVGGAAVLLFNVEGGVGGWGIG